MRLPWISIDSEGMTRGRLLGRLLGIHELEGVGMAISLWQNAVELCRDGDFSGTVPSIEFIAAACGWPTDDAKRLVDALQQVGLVATAPELRVRGLDRYQRTWEKNRNFHRKTKSAKSRRDVPSTGALTAKDGAEDEDEDEDEENDDALRVAPKTEKVKRPRRPSAAEDFFGWLNATRASTKKFDAQPAPSSARLNKSFGDAITQVGRPELERRYQAFLADPLPGSKDPPWPWEVFAATWSWRKPSSTPVSKTRVVAAGEDPYADQLA